MCSSCWCSYSQSSCVVLLHVKPGSYERKNVVPSLVEWLRGIVIKFETSGVWCAFNELGTSLVGTNWIVNCWHFLLTHISSSQDLHTWAYPGTLQSSAVHPSQIPHWALPCYIVQASRFKLYKYKHYLTCSTLRVWTSLAKHTGCCPMDLSEWYLHAKLCTPYRTVEWMTSFVE